MIGQSLPADGDDAFAADRAWVRGFWEAMRPFAPNGATYVNFESETDEARIRDSYGEAKHRRLAALKAVWDPDNVFHRQRQHPARRAAAADIPQPRATSEPAGAAAGGTAGATCIRAVASRRDRRRGRRRRRLPRQELPASAAEVRDGQAGSRWRSRVSPRSRMFSTCSGVSWSNRCGAHALDVHRRRGLQRGEALVGEDGELTAAVLGADLPAHPAALLEPGHRVREPAARGQAAVGELAHPHHPARASRRGPRGSRSRRARCRSRG